MKQPLVIEDTSYLMLCRQIKQIALIVKFQPYCDDVAVNGCLLSPKQPDQFSKIKRCKNSPEQFVE